MDFNFNFFSFLPFLPVSNLIIESNNIEVLIIVAQKDEKRVSVNKKILYKIFINNSYIFEYSIYEDKEEHRFKNDDLILDLRSNPCILIKLRDTDPSN